MPTHLVYGATKQQRDAAKARREREARKRAESWARMVRSFAAARA